MCRAPTARPPRKAAATTAHRQKVAKTVKRRFWAAPYTLPGGEHDCLETCRFAGICELADSFRYFLFGVSIEKIQCAAVCNGYDAGCAGDGGGDVSTLFSWTRDCGSRSLVDRPFVAGYKFGDGLPPVFLRPDEDADVGVLLGNRAGVSDIPHLRLLGFAAGAAMKHSTEQDYYERIVRTLVYIQRHLDEELELESLASVAAFSRFHFHRVFRGLVGESLKEHIRRLRLERAALKLKQQGTPVTDIAFEAGFEAHESFTRAFGTMFGVSPSEYRAAHKPAPESASGTHLDDVSGYHAPDYGEPLSVEMKELVSMNIVFLRHVGPYSQVGPTWGRLMSWAGMRGLLGP